MSYIPKTVAPIATCTVCHGNGKVWIRCHSFNPALGHPCALVTCECVDAQIEDEKRRWHEATSRTTPMDNTAPVIDDRPALSKECCP